MVANEEGVITSVVDSSEVVIPSVAEVEVVVS